SLTPDEQARIQDAINALNATYNAATGAGLHVVLVTDPNQANIILRNAVTTADGGYADGLLGDAEMPYTLNGSDQSYQLDDGTPYLQFTGQVVANVVEGWNWYAGSSA